MLLSDIACVLALTARSQAYVQALARHDIELGRYLILSDGRPPAVPPENLKELGSGRYFDIDESVFSTLDSRKIGYEVIPSRDINGAEVQEALQKIPQRYILYSGYGGALLKPHLFQLGKKWLHIHAGMLPQYRGSTTAYYSLLDRGSLGATAIFLNEKIDEGTVIASAAFPPPERGELIDYIYDPYIRSCVLINALQTYAEEGAFPEREQEVCGAETYYIIHPVLKHIAILGLDADENEK